MTLPYRRAQLIKELRDKGLSFRAICAQVGCSSASIAKALRQPDMVRQIEREALAAKAALAAEIALARRDMDNAPLYKFRR